MDEKDIKDLKEALKDAKGVLAGPKFLGNVWITLEGLEVELRTKKDKK